jgi:hypothetical protein
MHYTKDKDKLLQAYLITRPICIILPLYKAIIFIAYNYISITSDIDIAIHIQSMVQTVQNVSNHLQTYQDNSECDQTFQTMLRQFRLCAGFSDNLQNVKTLSRLFKNWSIHNFFNL